VKPCKWGKKWGNHDMLWCEARKNGWILETARLAPFAGGGVDAELDRFANTVIARTKLDASGIEQPVPAMKYRTLSGKIMEFRWQPHEEPYKDQLKVGGQPVEFSQELLHRNPWVYQKVGGPLLIQYEGRRLAYDFDKWIRTETTPLLKAGARRGTSFYSRSVEVWRIASASDHGCCRPYRTGGINQGVVTSGMGVRKSRFRL